jgi:hypothetical protein
MADPTIKAPIAGVPTLSGTGAGTTTSDDKTPFPAIPNVEPTFVNQDDDYWKSIDAQRGNYLGDNEKGNQVWQEPGTVDQSGKSHPGRKYVLQQGSTPFTDARWYEGESQPTPFEFLEKSQLPGIYNAIRQSNGRDPWTGQQFIGRSGRPMSGSDLLDPANLADATALSGKIDAYRNTYDIIGPGLATELQDRRDGIEEVSKMKEDMSKLQSKDLESWNIMGKNVADIFKGDWANQGKDAAENERRAAFLDLISHANNLASEGMATMGRQPETQQGQGQGFNLPQVPAFARTIKGAIGTYLAELGSEAVGKGMSFVGNLFSKGENLNQLRRMLPVQLNQMKRDYIERVGDLAKANFRVTNRHIGYATDYGNDLMSEGIYSKTPITKSKAIPYPAEEVAERAAQKAQTAQGEAQAAQAAPPGFMPQLTPRTGFQRGGLVRPRLQNVPSYANQAELNAAGHPPGTLFHWQPTGGHYVTV